MWLINLALSPDEKSGLWSLKFSFKYRCALLETKYILIHLLYIVLYQQHSVRNVENLYFNLLHQIAEGYIFKYVKYL